MSSCENIRVNFAMFVCPICTYNGSASAEFSSNCICKVVLNFVGAFHFLFTWIKNGEFT
jgi:hypothetical protein